MTLHQTDYPVWPECTEHTNPEDSDAPEFECAGKSDCHAFPLAQWNTVFRPEGQAFADPQHAFVHCAGCTARDAAMEVWEEDHESDTGIQDWSGIICKVSPPTLYCLDCSEDSGDWIGHHEPEDDEE